MVRYWFGLFALACAASAMGAVYKWVDAQGVTHYSETPPQETQSREVRIQPAPSPGGEATAPAEPAPATSEAGEQKRAENYKKWCENARQNIAALEGGKPVVAINDDPQWSELDEEKRAAAIADAQRRVKKYCPAE